MNAITTGPVLSRSELIKGNTYAIRCLTSNVQFRVKKGGNVYCTITHPQSPTQKFRPCWNETRKALRKFESTQVVTVL